METYVVIVWYNLKNIELRKIYGLKGEEKQNTATNTGRFNIFARIRSFWEYTYQEYSILVLSVSLVLLHASQNSIMSMATHGNKNMSVYRQKIET